MSMIPPNGSKRTGSNKRKRIGFAVCLNNSKHENSVTYEDKHLKVNDRRINASFMEESTYSVGMYELLKQWVQDDPEKCLKMGNRNQPNPFIIPQNDTCNDTVGEPTSDICEGASLSGEPAMRSVPQPAVNISVNSMSNANSMELLKGHVENFKAIKLQKVGASAALVEAAMVDINRLRQKSSLHHSG